jgi:hypothetical protein
MGDTSRDDAPSTTAPARSRAARWLPLHTRSSSGQTGTPQGRPARATAGRNGWCLSGCGDPCSWRGRAPLAAQDKPDPPPESRKIGPEDSPGNLTHKPACGQEDWRIQGGQPGIGEDAASDPADTTPGDCGAGLPAERHDEVPLAFTNIERPGTAVQSNTRSAELADERVPAPSRHSDGQPVSPLRSSASQHLAPIRGAHAFQEPVTAFSLAPVRLIGPLHEISLCRRKV